MPWKDLYISEASLYVNGQKVLQTDLADNVVVSADPDQDLILKTSGSGNIELNPTASQGGQILLKSNVVLTGTKTFGTSDSSPVIFSNGISTPSIITSVLNGGIAITPNGTGNTYVTAGNFGIGTTTPTARLHLQAGSATAGTAPLKLTGGPVLSTPEIGAIEFLNDAYYGTITTAAARKQFAFIDSNITGTASNSNLLENHNAAYFQIAGSYLTPTSSLDPANVNQTATYRFVSDAEKSTWNGKQLGNANLTSLSGLSYTSGAPFIKMTGANTFAFDNNTYLTSLSGALLVDGTVTGAIAQAQTFTNGIISNATSTFTGNVGIGTSSLAGAKFKIAVDSSAIADNYSDLSKISSNTNASAVSGKLQISEAICGAYTVQGAGGLTYGTVLGPDGKCWMTKNLGAAQVATSATDASSYGYYYQWGRPTDGHQIENSATTSVNSDSDIPGHGNFITESDSPYDWRVPQIAAGTTLWPATGGLNNPCPTGWHVPTQPEWATVAGYFSPQTSVGAFNSTLKLPLAGFRDRVDAALNFRGSYGYYWSGSPSDTYASNLYFNSGGVNPAYVNNRANGFSVRCVKD